MSIKPILFNAEMVQAILDGRKTQTRRIVKGIEGLNVYRAEPSFEDAYDTPCSFDFFHGWSDNGAMFDATKPVKAPCSAGDILWVRETWDNIPASPGGHFRMGGRYYYKADGDIRPPGWQGNWHPSIHMPREAARIFLFVKNIRVERIRDITEKDAIAEGMPDSLDYPVSPVYCPRCRGEGLIGSHTGHGFVEIDCPICDTAVKRFGNLWNSTIKKADLYKYGWEANPWVWVIEFSRCEKLEGWCK